MAASSLEQKLSRLEAKLKQENREARRRIDLNLDISPQRPRPSKHGGVGEGAGGRPDGPQGWAANAACVWGARSGRTGCLLMACGTLSFANGQAHLRQPLPCPSVCLGPLPTVWAQGGPARPTARSKMKLERKPDAYLSGKSDFSPVFLFCVLSTQHPLWHRDMGLITPDRPHLRPSGRAFPPLVLCTDCVLSPSF